MPYTEKQKRAWMQYQEAVRAGKIVRQPCEICGDPDAEGHHEDYDKPFDVRWLCHKHHGEEHSGVGMLRRELSEIQPGSLTAHSVIERHNLIANPSKSLIWQASYELATSEGIDYVAAKMRIVRQLKRASKNIAAGREAYADSRGGIRPGQGRPPKWFVCQVCGSWYKKSELAAGKCECGGDVVWEELSGAMPNAGRTQKGNTK